MTSQKGSRFTDIEILTSPSVLSPHKTYTYLFLDQNNHLIVLYFVLDEFWAVLGKIRGQ